jgi:hypothetical protein
MNLRFPFLLALASLLAGCSSVSEKKEAEKLSDSDIRVATFYYMFDHWSHRSRPGHNFYLSVDEPEMLPKLLERFEEEGFPVLPGFQYEHGLGIRCSVERIEVVSERRARVYGGYLCGDLGGEWGYYELERVAGRWRVLSWSPDMLASTEEGPTSRHRQLRGADAPLRV